MVWQNRCRINPIPKLISSKDPALTFFVRRDLLDEAVEPVEKLWKLPVVAKLLSKQLADGSWNYPGQGKKYHPQENYDLLQTYRNLRLLVEQFGFTKQHDDISKTADYFSRINRTKVIIRGIFGAQYALHYSAGIFELLIKSGYEQDYRLKKGLDWLLSVRQFDGGWASPLRTNDIRYAKAIENLEPIQPDRDKPFSHTLTGFIIRAFAAHPDYRNLSDVKSAGQILKARFFKSDKYSDRKAADYWLKFQYPFWWAHILTGLDSLYYLQFPSSDPDIRRGLAWFIDHQAGDGLWPTGYDKGQLVNQNRLWVGFAVSRVLKNYFA